MDSIVQFERIGFYSRQNFIEVLNVGFGFNLSFKTDFDQVADTIKRVSI